MGQMMELHIKWLILSITPLSNKNNDSCKHFTGYIVKSSLERKHTFVFAALSPKHKKTKQFSLIDVEK